MRAEEAGADVAATRLYRLARERRPDRRQPNDERGVAGADSVERCELCGAAIADAHRHLLDMSARRLLCACRACSMLFAHGSVGQQQLRLVPEEIRRPDGFEMDDATWAALAIPVDIAFFFLDTAARRTVALYPGALGVTESRLSLDAWHAIVRRNPVLAGLEPDVEALLVNRTRGAREQWLVPVDVCYQLAGLIRTHWKGLAGGEEVWRQLDLFFDDLRRRALGAAAPLPNVHSSLNMELTP